MHIKNLAIATAALLSALRHPAQATHDSRRRFARILQAETVFLLAAVVAAGVLTSTAPPMAS